MRDFLNAVDRADVVEGIDRGRETAVKAEDLARRQRFFFKRGGPTWLSIKAVSGR